MTKAIVGSIIGGLVAGAVAIVASAAGTSREPADAWSVGAGNAAIADASGIDAVTSAPAVIQCEPGQRAELRRVSMNGREVAQLACVTALPLAAPQAAAYPVSDIVAAPAVQRAPAATPVARERIVTRETVRRPAKRSWAKSALVIGGGTGAGAGIGGLIGGKKGALIGAALGGGSTAIYEAIKR